MSTVPPLTPQGVPGQPYPPVPVKNSVSPVVWVLVGIGSFLFIGLLVLIGAGLFFAYKVKQAGLDPGSMRRNPGLAVVKVMAALNPNIEVVSVNEDKGIVTVREKKSGNTYTVSFEDAKKGRFVFQENGKAPVTVVSGGEAGNGTLEIKSNEGTLKVGGGARTKVPAWVPDYPASNPEEAFSAQTAEGNSGSYTFKTKDPVGKVAKYYEDAFKSTGLKSTSMMGSDAGKNLGGMVTAEAGDKSAVVLLGSEDGQTAVSVTFKVRK